MDPSLPDGAYVAALAGFRGMGPRRLRLLLHHHRPSEAYELLRRGAPTAVIGRFVDDAVRSQWRRDAEDREPARCWDQCRAASIDVVVHGGAGYPAMLRHDPVPPAALFVRGNLAVFDARRVGIVGTRNATRGGVDTAAALGADLASAGVTVVSGLARGIDGAAHRGVVDAGGVPAAVVGNGPDHAYPRCNAALWERVVERGVLLSEWPPGTRPEPFRFPMRNRILAALSEVLVVVESRERGGSLSTVREADERGVQVMAVPGSPRVRAAAGTNQLLCAGAAPVTCADDVLVALGLDTRRRGPATYDPRLLPDADGARVLELCRKGPRTLDDVVGGLDLAIADAAMALARLERSGWLIESGGWFQVAGAWSGVPEPESSPSTAVPGDQGSMAGEP